MPNSRKTAWILAAIYVFIMLGVSYLVDKNQDNLNFLLSMKEYIPSMLYFSIAGVVLFLFVFTFYQMDTSKAKRLITQLENEKNQLKAKLFDMQEEKDKTPSTTKVIEAPKNETAEEEHPSNTEDNTE